jgi:hypothetical protein
MSGELFGIFQMLVDLSNALGVIQKATGPQMQSLFKVSSRPTGGAQEGDDDYDLDD